MEDCAPMKPTNSLSPRPRRPYVVAFLLGSTLTALGAAAPAAAAPARAADQAVSDLSRYCTACWRNARLPADCWGDCTQDVLSRLLRSVAPERWGELLRGDSEDRQEFLRAIDAVKKRAQRALRRSSQLVGVVADRRAEQDARLAEDREAVRAASAELLTPRQQRIMLRSFEGCSAQEIADELGTTAARVSDEKYKAVRKLRAHLCRDGDA
jgi:RNA polymerase sigma factor (sigma-70 family)